MRFILLRGYSVCRKKHVNAIDSLKPNHAGSNTVVIRLFHRGFRDNSIRPRTVIIVVKGQCSGQMIKNS